MNRKASICVATAVLAVGFADIAAARVIRINFGDAGFPGSGESWNGNNDDDAVDVTGNGDASGALPFQLRIGDTAFTDYCLAENGYVSFATIDDACNPGATDPLATFSILEADWLSVFDGFSITEGAVSISQGFLDPVANADGEYDIDEQLPAMRFLWNGVQLDGSDDSYFFQLILLDIGDSDDGNFDAEFNYGFNSIYNVPGLQPSIVSGGLELYRNNDPTVSSAVDYFFTAREGTLTASTSPPPPPTSVPEPGSLSLLLLGAAALYLRRRAAAV